MASSIEIRRHIRSVSNITQVTRAMKMVSASKMTRAQHEAVVARSFTERAGRLLTHLAAEREGDGQGMLHRLFEQRPLESIELLLVTSSRGFCGAMNLSVIQRAVQFISEQSVPVRLVTVGSKARDQMLRFGAQIVAEFAGVADEKSLDEFGTPIAEVLIDDYQRGLADAVYMVFAQFVNTLVQQPSLRQLLPVPSALALGRASPPPYIYEPDRKELLADLVPRLVTLQVALVLRESMASEHSARTVAMRQASDNAQEMLDDLTMQANRLRQRKITQEVLEVSEGAIVAPSFRSSSSKG